MRQSLLILGAGGHGRVVADAAAELGYAQIGFLDDAAQAEGHSGPFEVIGPMTRLDELLEWGDAISAIGDNGLRLRLFGRLTALGFRTPSIIHRHAIVSRHAAIGAGTFIAAGAIVAIGAAVREAAVVNTGAAVDHDCRVGSGAHVSPGAHLGGRVTVGERAWIGIGASIKNGVTVGAGAIVGAGATVIRDVPESETVAGVPARRLGKKD